MYYRKIAPSDVFDWKDIWESSEVLKNEGISLSEGLKMLHAKDFACKVEYQDQSWAMLKFENTSLAFVLPEEHPYHFAILTDDLSPYGDAVPHQDGTRSVYIRDIGGHNVEVIKLKEEENN